MKNRFFRARNMMACKLALLAVCILCCDAMSGQTDLADWSITHITSRDGIRSDEVAGYRVVIPYEDGYTYLGSDLGTNFTDGTGFYEIPVKNEEFHSALADDVNCMLKDSKGRLWIGTWGEGLVMSDVHRVIDTVFLTPIPGVSEARYIKCLFEDYRGRIWVGIGEAGLALYDEDDRTFEHVPLFLDSVLLRRYDFYQNNLRNVVIDDETPSRAWITSLFGLVEFDVDTREVQYHFQYDPLPPMRSRGRVEESWREIWQDDNGNLWITNWAEQLIRFDKADKSFTPFECFEHAGERTCPEFVGLLPLSDNELLVASPEVGLLIFDMQRETFSRFSTETSMRLPDDPFAIARDLVDNIWVSCLYDGIYLFTNPKNVEAEPRAIITSMTLFDKPFELERDSHQAITLHHTENFFSFTYSAFDPAFDQNKEFSYQLEGLDPDWIEAGDRRYTSYTNVGGGDYTFKVRVRRKGGQWSDAVALQSISVTPPIWQRLWFLVLAAAAVLTGVFLLYRNKIARVRQEEAVKSRFQKRLAEVEMQALRAQMNPHFLFNSLNSIKYYVVDKSPVKAAEYIDRFSRLIRLILQNSRQKVIPLSSELEALELYIQVEQLRFEDRFEYEIDIENGLDTHFYQIPPLLLQPYVENAIWHGLMHKTSHGHLRVGVTHVGETLTISIEDNGIGRAQSAQLQSGSTFKKHSLGMQLTEDRMKISEELMNVAIDVTIHDLKDPDDRPLGTRVVITLTPQHVEI